MAIRTVTVPPRSGAGNDPTFQVVFGLGIGVPQAIGEDVCPPYRVQDAGAPFEFEARAKVAPSGDALNLDVLVSDDDGATWTSIFPDAGKPVIANGSSNWIRETAFRTSMVFAADDWLRADVLAGSAENAAQITLILRWR